MFVCGCYAGIIHERLTKKIFLYQNKLGISYKSARKIKGEIKFLTLCDKSNYHGIAFLEVNNYRYLTIDFFFFFHSSISVT